MANGHTNGANGTHSNGHHLGFDSIEDTVAAFRQGEFVLVLDDTSRENEGDLIIASEDVTTEKMAFLIHHSSGYVCAPITHKRADELDLPIMVNDNRDPFRTQYTITIDAISEGVTTGISAHDRAVTVRAMASSKSTSSSFRRPGHIVPLRAKDGGVRARRGHTEAAVELCRLAGKADAATICEIVMPGEVVPGRTEMPGGRMMRRDDCLAFGKKWGIKVCTIEDMVEYVEAKEGKLNA